MIDSKSTYNSNNGMYGELLEVKNKTDKEIEQAMLDSSPINESGIKAGLKFVKENEALIAVFITICGAAFSLIGKYMDYYLAIVRFSKFNIPQTFLNDFTQKNSFVLMLAEFVSVSIGIFISFLFNNNYKYKRKTKKARNNLLFRDILTNVLCLSIPLSLVNVFYAFLHAGFPVWYYFFICLSFGMMESMMGFQLNLYLTMFKKQKEKRKPIIILYIICIVVLMFVLSIVFSTNLNISTSRDYMIGNDRGNQFVVVCTDSNYAITEKCEIKTDGKKKVLYIDTTEQTIMSLDRLNYKNVVVDKTVWRGNE